MRIIRFFVCFLLLTAFGKQSYAQSIEKMTPPSPTAASIARYGDLPPSGYTGSMGVNVPIYTMEEGDIKIPVSLNASTGIPKVSEIPGWVGLGWSLNAGGAISRIVMGAPDDLSFGGPTGANAPGFLFHQSDLLQLRQGIATHVYPQAIMNNVENGVIDAEPDIFTFNFNGYSGRFSFDDYGVPHVASFQNIKIEKTLGNEYNKEGVTTTNFIDSWTITTPDGFQYVFSAKEWSRVTRTIATNEHLTFHVSSWYLTQIYSPSGKMATFNYTVTDKYRYQEHFFERFGQWYCGQIVSIPTSAAPSVSLDQVIYLTSIETSYSRMDFITSPRNDMVIAPYGSYPLTLQERKLDTIHLVNLENNQIVKKVKLEYEDNPSVRLALKDVYDISGSTTANHYKIEYNDYYYIPYNSKAIDHWGFYNGQYNNSLIPKTEVNIPGVGLETLGQADREAYLYLLGSIKRVYYPTGGYTEFEYEPHDYSHVNNEDGGFWRYYTEMYQGIWERGGGSTDFQFDLAEAIDVRIEYSCSADNTGLISYCESGTKIINPSLGPGSYSYLTDLVYLFPALQQGWQLGEFFSVEGWATVTRQEWVSNPVTGGARIKTVAHYPTTGSPVIKSYRYQDDPDHSSGVIGTRPQYLFTVSTIPSNICNRGFWLQSSSILPLSVTAGSHIGYSRVEEINADSSKTVFYYSTFKDYPDAESATLLGSWDPYGDKTNMGPVTSYEPYRGLLKRSEYYNSLGDVVKTTVNEYKNMTENSYEEQFYVFTGIPNYSASAPGQNTLYTIINAYNVLSRCIVKDKETETTFSNGLELNVSTEYEYGLHALPTRIERKDSKDVLKVEKIYYPQDMPSIEPYISLISQHKMNAAIKKEVLSISGQDSTLLMYDFTNFKDWGGGHVLPEYYERKIGDNEIFRKAEVLAYNLLNDKPSVYREQDGIIRTLLWGYQDIFPVAEVANASLNEIYYNSFEESPGTADLSAKTGGKSYAGDFAINFQIPSGTARSFVLTYWYWDGAKWAFKSVPYLGPVTISDGSKIDEVRVYPSNAHMISYTYTPVLGLTSVCTANNAVSYYEYDSFKRLKLIRDQNGKILKQYDYQYKVPVTQ